MRKLLCSLPVLLALTLAAATAASTRTAPDTRAVSFPANGSTTAGGTALISVPAPLDPAPSQVPAPVDLSVLPVTCYASCDGVACPVSTCNGTLAFCCAASRRLACKLHGGEFSGTCTDGISSLVC